MSAKVATRILAQDGDTLELAAWRHYGRQDEALVVAVMEAPANARLLVHLQVPAGEPIFMPADSADRTIVTARRALELYE